MPDPDPKPDDKPTPNRPRDPGVYGGQWGGGVKTPGPPPPDRPEPIKPPPEGG
jgi:hypothetical protein